MVFVLGGHLLRALTDEESGSPTCLVYLFYIIRLRLMAPEKQGFKNQVIAKFSALALFLNMPVFFQSLTYSAFPESLRLIEREILCNVIYISPLCQGSYH